MVSVASSDATSRTTAPRIFIGVTIAVVAAIAANTVVALLAVAAGASEDFRPLQPGTYIGLTVFGVLAGAAGWAGVRRWSRHPGGVLRWLVPVAVGISLLPDVALLFTDMQPNTSGLAVAALMAMHVATAAVAVPAFARALPLPSAR
jgi:hypothetical protein